jgi:hypothetical protein
MPGFMDTAMQLQILRDLQKSDETFLREHNNPPTQCSNCRRNTFVGLYPFWHRFARTLCSECGAAYTQLLKEINAYDRFN